MRFQEMTLPYQMLKPKLQDCWTAEERQIDICFMNYLEFAKSCENLVSCELDIPWIYW